MCGIAGVVGARNEKIIDQMIQVQKHRGPDNTSTWKKHLIQLGHNRLSIIDLSEEANQPFLLDDYVLVFNGEIYNYLELKKELKEFDFKTNSDTEVLLASYKKWGKNCLHKLNGMFAFAIWNTKTDTLFAARDRFGVKPFYYAIEDNVLYFASEIKTLFAAGIQKVPNKKVWANYFLYGNYGMPNETFWKNIKQLPGGFFLEYTSNNIAKTRWYDFKEEIKKHFNQNLTYEEVQKKYVRLLEDSIKLRFRADVPVGFNISGGLDSSALLSFVNQNENATKLKAFTFYTNDERYDELPWVEEMISLTENPLKKILLKAEEVSILSDKISYHQDEPFGGIPTLAYSKIFEEARAERILVLLDGQGMDEQWAGYDYYVSSTNSNTIQGVQKSPFRENVLTKELLNHTDKPEYPKPFKDELLNKQYRDLFFTKIPRALRFNDRISMAYSTELREPFLDYRLVEFAFAQPKEYKIKKGIQKSMLREIVSKHLSDSITYAPKRPLQTPQREWLAEELKKEVNFGIEKISKSKYGSWFDIAEMKREWNNYLEGDNDSSFHIWQWLNFSLLIDD